jgi:hypothetical protein
MCSKGTTSKGASQEETTSADSSSGGDDQFIIAPRPRRAVRKTRAGASSSRANTEAADITESWVVREAREVRESGIIQKVERPLRPDYEYTFRRVDRRHPRRSTDFTRGENQSMINRNENPYDWTAEYHDHRF